tara:strand:- start:373 stop:771 length:399 start_codon:yes stop_codon:yes gene_type:complete
MEQNISWKTLKGSALLLMTSMMVSNCSLIPTKQIEVSAKPIERTIVQPIMPREIDLREVRWLTITPENFEEQFKIIEEQEGELVFLAMTIPDYETMAYNMQELKRYITELKDVVVYYREVTTADLNNGDTNN